CPSKPAWVRNAGSDSGYAVLRKGRRFPWNSRLSEYPALAHPVPHEYGGKIERESQKQQDQGGRVLDPHGLFDIGGLGGHDIEMVAQLHELIRELIRQLRQEVGRAREQDGNDFAG